MDDNYYEIMKIINQSQNPNHYSIPEFGMEFESDNPAITALYLMPMVKLDLAGKRQIVEKIDKTKVVEAMNLITDLHEGGLTYIVIVGKNANRALKYLKKKHSSLIADDDKLKVIIKHNEIHVPIKLGPEVTGDSLFLSKILSFSDVTVINYDDFSAVVFSRGEKVSFNIIEAPGFIRFVSTLGFYIDEYLLGELLSAISRERKDISELFLNNLDTAFVKSLCNFIEMHQENYGMKKHYYKNRDNLNLEQLFNIVDTMGFEYIKNMNYDFVSVMLYEE